ncbi:hypothetical protein F2Q69_00016043 [Brassica cretica]|uniref:Uncharacterized protein n=1 Tax=Brassica cretica TaxID=69181 RepID=A0A8S9R2I9_BRACR|nr:hypothetical protein F2Q69_00016043 [Brassica cretica]
MSRSIRSISPPSLLPAGGGRFSASGCAPGGTVSSGITAFVVTVDTFPARVLSIRSISPPSLLPAGGGRFSAVGCAPGGTVSSGF